MSCPTFETLVEFSDGRLTGAEAADVARHLDTDCRSCREAVSWYSAFVETAAEDRSVEPPSWVLRRATDAFEDARAAASRRGVRGLVARLRASLVFDSLMEQAGEVVFERSAASPSRQLLYSAVPYDIDLLVAEGATPRSLAVSGQVLPVDGEDFGSIRGLSVTIEQEGVAVATVRTTDLGEFSVAGIAPGNYDLRLSNDEREIVVSRTPLRLD